jgi:hypothetical protein
MRQEENQHLANDIEEIKKLPEWLQERTGYGISRIFLRGVDLSHPMHVLHPGDENIGTFSEIIEPQPSAQSVVKAYADI